MRHRKLFLEPDLERSMTEEEGQRWSSMKMGHFDLSMPIMPRRSQLINSAFLEDEVLVFDIV